MSNLQGEEKVASDRRLEGVANRVIFMFAAFAGIGLIVVGVWIGRPEAVRPPSPPWLTFEPVTCELGEVTEGEARMVPISVSNRHGSSVARLLGANNHCGPEGCVFWRGDPITVQPGQTAIFEVEWKGSQAGRVVQELTVFTDCPGQAIVQLSIAGEVIAAKSNPFGLFL